MRTGLGPATRCLEGLLAWRLSLNRWQADAGHAGLAAQVFTYPGAGHFYTDPDLADYHPASAGQTWQRVTAFLSAL